MMAAVDALYAYCQSQQKRLIAMLREFVECESPSEDPEAVDRFADLLASKVNGKPKIKKLRSSGCLRIEFALPGGNKDGQVLALGHADTVWPSGTLRTMPFREEKGRLWGPGVLDMKAGLAFFLIAMEGLRELDIPLRRKVLLQVNVDEEIGSHLSRASTERAASESVAVLVLEPGTGLEGKLKTARKGIGDYTITVQGRASHAGVDFAAGASAVVELAHQIQKIAAFTDLERGLTVNPGTVRGGTRTNVVAAEAQAGIDFRVARLRDAKPLDRRFRNLKPLDRRCRLTIEGGLNRPPMERTAGIVKLFQLACGLAKEIGINLEESATGGGSDGNFTAALGIPTLDGLGAVGEGAHADNESILVNRITDRTALLGKLVAAL